MEWPKVDYSLCERPEKKLLGGQVCLYLGIFGLQGKCSLDKKACKPYQEYQKQYRKFIKKEKK